MSSAICLSPMSEVRKSRSSSITSPQRTSSFRRLRMALSPSRLGGATKHSRSPVRNSYISYNSAFTTADYQSDASGMPSPSGSLTESTRSFDNHPHATVGAAAVAAGAAVHGSNIRQVLSLRAMRRQPSALEAEIEEEKALLGTAVWDMPMEPRPVDDMALIGGIFEVLAGRI